MAFTSYSDLYLKMLDDLASGNWAVESYVIGQRTMKYRGFAEFRLALDWVATQAALEEKRASGHVYAQSGQDYC